MADGKNHINYEFVILEFIRDNPGGVTITDIANDTGFSRNTVSKYVSILELKNQIFIRKIGAYNLYFSSKTSFLPTITILSYYKSLLIGLKEVVPNIEKELQKIGRDAAYNKRIKFAFSQDVFNQLKSLKGTPVSMRHLEVFQNFYPSYDIFQPNIIIDILKIDPQNKQATYRFRNSVFLENTEDYIYHIYIGSGITEGILSRELDKDVKCTVENIFVSEDDKEESFFDLTIQIK